MKGMNLWAFLFTNLENRSILSFHFPTTNSLPLNPMRNIIISPIAKAIPAVIPKAIGFKPPAANVANTAKKETEPPVEKPPKKEITNRIR